MKKAKIHMADGGDIVIELFEKEAPGTVQNFIDLINKGFYNGLRFHRVIPGFVAQGGCPNGNGTGGPGYTIKDELVGNPHKHERGALSMAHRGPNTGGSQFFIVYEPQPHLDGVHTVFGKVRSLRVAMDYLITPGYPTELLNKRNLTRADLNSIPKDKIRIPNYWAIVAYLACMRIKNDPELIDMIKDNKLPYMAVRRNAIEGYDEQPIYAYESIYQMNRYLAILSAISELIKHDRFDDENIRKLVNNAKDKPHLNLFHGVAYNLVDAITTEQNNE